MAITTVAAWKARRGISATTWDAIVPNIIDAVQAEIERYCSRAFESATYTDEAYHGTGTDTLILRNWPVTAVSAVKIVASDGTTTTLDSGDYRADLSANDRGHLYRIRSSDFGWGEPSGACWPEGRLNVKVTYTGGYATVPHDVEEAAFCLIDSKLAASGVNIYEQARGEGNENRTMRSAEDSKAEAHRLLGPFRRLP